MNPFLNDFYRGKRVFVTGHTGFKGSWLCLLLNRLGAEVYGYALKPPTDPSLYDAAKIDRLINSTIGDIRDLDHLKRSIVLANPDVVIHMAAQPIVRDSYRIPVDTYSVNVMGTVHILEACRCVSGVKAIVNVTTDKCYHNREWFWGYREDEAMGGYDPYSSSKGCSELVTSAYRNSYFNPTDYDDHGVGLASARAGNVIGGGDWANDRLIPDFIRSIVKKESIQIRNPDAIRPWQHVLEPLVGYLFLAYNLYFNGPSFSEGWNFGPDDCDAKSVKWVISTICNFWGDNAKYEVNESSGGHESLYLKLDCSKAKALLGWRPQLNISQALKKVVDWNQGFLQGEDVYNLTNRQIDEYLKLL